MFHLTILEEPQKVSQFRVNGKPVYKTCAECDTKEAIIVAAITDNEGRTALLADGNSAILKSAVFCADCLEIVREKYHIR